MIHAFFQKSYSGKCVQQPFKITGCSLRSPTTDVNCQVGYNFWCCSRYRDWATGWTVRGSNPARKRVLSVLQNVQANSGAHPALCWIGTGDVLPGSKTAGACGYSRSSSDGNCECSSASTPLPSNMTSRCV